MQQRVVGLSGPIGAGKTTAARHLESLGFAYGRFSRVLAGMLEAESREVNRENLQRLGQRVHEHPGQAWLCSKLLDSLPSDSNLVIDGLRHPDDHQFFRQRFGLNFSHIFVDAPGQLRSGRYVERGGSLQEFNQAGAHEVERNVEALKKMADFVIENNQTLQSFLDGLVERLGLADST